MTFYHADEFPLVDLMAVRSDISAGDAGVDKSADRTAGLMQI
jgi:hypothetical protein